MITKKTELCYNDYTLVDFKIIVALSPNLLKNVYEDLNNYILL